MEMESQVVGKAEGYFGLVDRLHVLMSRDSAGKRLLNTLISAHNRYSYGAPGTGREVPFP